MGDAYRVRYLPTNDVTASVELYDLHLNFQGDNFETLISQKHGELMQNEWYALRFWYLQSNGAIANVVQHHWPRLSRLNILNVNTPKTVRVAHKLWRL